jgi:deoxyribodipyrimidine photo-lyase
MYTAIVWFTRDLRVHDHPALAAAATRYERIVPLFVLDPTLLHGRFASGPRASFMLGCLEELDAQLKARGSRLVVRRGAPERVLVELAREVSATTVLWTSDVSPYARRRDRRVTQALTSSGIASQPQPGNYIVDVSRLRTQDGQPYRVFSHFFRSWRDAARRDPLRAPRALAPVPERLNPGTLPRSLAELGIDAQHELANPAVIPGEPAARSAARRWLSGPIDNHASRQNGIARLGTSKLSPYLRWGCVSPLELELRAEARGGAGAAAWIRQLCWRDFYAHVLLHWPENLVQAFQSRLRTLEYDTDEQRLQAWQEGRTGYPVVDAGMRELARTGWMHNRARLIVGSFLTKDLHLDWREGELWFERLLLDGEPAQNNGNWQWIASVGTDPAPAYRRMYNPTLQGRRFDPRGEYVRAWLPELAGVPDEKLLEPWTMTRAEQRAAGCTISLDYPAPIVDHSRERRRALARYSAAAALVSS